MDKTNLTTVSAVNELIITLSRLNVSAIDMAKNILNTSEVSEGLDFVKIVAGAPDTISTHGLITLRDIALTELSMYLLGEGNDGHY